MKRHKDKMTMQTTGRLTELRQKVGEFEILEGGLDWAEETLRESEARYRSIVETTGAGVATIDLKGEFTFANETLGGMLGYTSQKLLGKSFVEFLSTEDRETIFSAFQNAIQGQITGTLLEFRVVHKDGHVLWWQSSPTPVTGGSGVVGFNAVVFDITERKQAEEALRESEERYRLLFDSGNDAVFVRQPTPEGMLGQFIEVNDIACQRLGYTREELLRLSPLDIMAPQYLAGVPAATEKLFAEKYVVAELVHVAKDGRQIPVEVGSHLFDLEGQTTVLSVARDITERKQAEEALRESEEKYRILFESKVEGVVVIDETMKPLLANQAAVEIFGFDSVEELLEVNPLDLIPPEERDRAISIMTEDMFENDLRQVNEFRFTKKSGEEVWISAIGALTEFQGKPAGLASFRDITDHKRAEEALQEAEARYRGLVEGALDVIFTISVDGRLTSLNPAFEVITGWPCAEWIGKQFASIVHPDDLPIAAEAFQNALRADLSQAYEVRFLAKSGEYLVGEIKGGPQIENGRVVGVWGMARDITERKRAEEVLREAEERHRAIVEQAAESIVLVDAETGELVDFNDRAHDNLVYSREEFSKLKITDFEVIESPEEVTRHIEKIAKEGSDLFETKHRTKAGEIRDIEVSSRAIAIAGRTYIQSIWHDITERKLAEAALKESEARYRALVNLGDKVGETIVMVQDTEQGNAIHTFVSDHWPRITGYSRKELLSMSFFDLLHPRYQEASFRRHRRKMGGEIIPGLFEMSIIRKDGVEVPVELTSAYTTYQGQRANVAFIRDITERKQIEEERQRMEKLESIGTLAGGIAHDFNNLLTGIMGNIGLARRHVEPKGKAEERLLEAEKASMRARDLTQQLLTFARGGLPIKRLVSIAGLIEESALFALRGSSVKPVLSLSDDIWSVEVDEGQMNQVIHNLVRNAEEAMPDGGILNIGAKNTAIEREGYLPLAKGNYVEITVEDHGVGIKKGHLPKIFEPYFTTKQKGSGLGLSTAYSIIKNHDGHVTVESQLGIGTTFHIYLPASSRRAPQRREEVVQPSLLEAGRILAMDDEELIRDLLYSELSDIGYEVELASDGAEAIERYAEAKESGKPFDAVIMDLTVPGGMGGKEAIKKLLEIDPEAKVIVSSGYSTDPIMADYRKYGFSAVATKPYRVEELEKILETLHKTKHK